MPDRAVPLARFGAAAVIELMQTVAETSDRECRKECNENQTGYYDKYFLAFNKV